MTELLAVPAWETPPTPLAEWTERLKSQGLEVVVTRESGSVSWLEVASLRMRGYVVMEGDHVEAINFELMSFDPAPARAVLARVASELAWELHEEEGEDDDAEN